MPRISVLCAAAFLLAASPVLAAGYDAELDPAPFDATNRADVIGSIGNATATLDGSTLTVEHVVDGGHVRVVFLGQFLV